MQVDRLMYVDDSGHPQAGLVVFGWIEFPPERWASVLRIRLDLRKRLRRDFGISVETELHTTEFVNGRGRVTERPPSRHIHDGVAFWKDLGRELAHECLDSLRSTEGIKVGAVFGRGAPQDHQHTRAAVYGRLVEIVEDDLARTRETGMIFMDGDGSDGTYRRAHRGLKLESRRVIEDALQIDSRHSQFIQMADLVAWCANASVDPHPRNDFAQDWYQNFLAERDPRRAPTDLSSALNS